MKLYQCIMSFAMNKSKCLLLFLIIIHTDVVLSSQDNVKVSLYYEALCPYCEEFINEQLYPGYQLLGDALTLEMVPYGNAEHEKVDGKWNISCQHGPEECYANKIQACVLGMNHSQAESMDFIGCVMLTDNAQDDENAKKCAHKTKLSWTDIETCANGDEGTELLVQLGEKTKNLIPPFRYVPHILFNDISNRTTELAARRDFLKTVCGIFKNKPSAC